MLFSIRHRKNPAVTLPLPEDPDAHFPPWVRAQLGVRRSYEVVRKLIPLSFEEYAATPGIPDERGVFVTPQDARDYWEWVRWDKGLEVTR